MITAIVTSDNHLGVYYARLRPERLEQRRKRLQQAFARVVDAAIERGVDLFLHAGDLFDRPDPRNADRVFVAQQVRRLQKAGIPICAIAGNHDSPRSLGYDGGILPQEEMDALGAIRLFRATDALDGETFTIRGQRVRVRGMSSDFNRPSGACPLQELQDGERQPRKRTVEEHNAEGLPSPQMEAHDAAAKEECCIDTDLVLLHYGVEGWAREDAQEPCLALSNLDSLRADAICVGHLHARNQKRLPGGALLLNPGATEHIHFGEEKLDCGFWMLHCQPGHVEADYVPAAPQPMQTIHIDVTEAMVAADETNEQNTLEVLTPLMCLLVARMEAAARPDQLLRVRLAGRIPRARYQEIDLNLLQARGLAANFHCQLDTEPLIACDEFADLSFGYGVSFEVETELQNTVREMMTLYADDPRRQDILARAGRDIAAAYARLG